MTTAAIRSLWKHHPDCRVVIFDNSDKEPFGHSEEPLGTVAVIDNTRGQLIDFEKELERPRRMLGPMPKDWEGIRKAGLDWFLIRWMTARNIVSDFCLTFIIVKIVLLFV